MDHGPTSLERRHFLQQLRRYAWAGAGAPLAMNLAALREAAAAGPQDYRALVCVWLEGGNDHDNTVVPFDPASHDAYRSARGGLDRDGGLALTREALQASALAPAVALPGGRQYALHPELLSLANLFNEGRMAVMLNVGPLARPTTRAEYAESSRTGFPLPPRLFSHNDQSSVWQSSSPEGAAVGWGGRIGDAAYAGGAPHRYACISTSGNAVLLSGRSTLQYQLTTRGAVPMECTRVGGYITRSVRDTLVELMTGTPSGVLEAEYNKVVARAIEAEAEVSAALAGANVAAPFPGDELGAQLKIVARLIAARASLGAGRQIFMVSTGSFDTHSGLIGRHRGLMRQLGPAMAAFYIATVELGIADKVTTFTASEFGRTLSGNGDGSDHGWGGHHLVVGGAVRGKAFYGTAPPVSIGNTASADDQWHVGQGRLLPSTSVDQYVATLASWFGVAADQLPTVLPNLRHFGAAAGRPDYPTNLGFV